MENSFNLKKFLAEGKMLNEQPSSKEALIQQLITLAQSGELDTDEINDINYQLKSARRKMFASKITPDQRKASAEKSAATKTRNAELELATNQVFKILGVEKDYPTQFALSLNIHRDKELQKRFNNELQNILNK